jgi:hypothetical protein
VTESKGVCQVTISKGLSAANRPPRVCQYGGAEQQVPRHVDGIGTTVERVFTTVLDEELPLSVAPRLSWLIAYKGEQLFNSR